MPRDCVICVFPAVADVILGTGYYICMFFSRAKPPAAVFLFKEAPTSILHVPKSRGAILTIQVFYMFHRRVELY